MRRKKCNTFCSQKTCRSFTLATCYAFASHDLNGIPTELGDARAICPMDTVKNCLKNFHTTGFVRELANQGWGDGWDKKEKERKRKNLLVRMLKIRKKARQTQKSQNQRMMPQNRPIQSMYGLKILGQGIFLDGHRTCERETSWFSDGAIGNSVGCNGGNAFCFACGGASIDG